ncbi:MAG: hypothetical protein ACRDRO_00640 [Pseudonocardiaceae bacterium]
MARLHVRLRSLRDARKNSAHAHLGMIVPGFPSLFILYGPNTNTSGGSIIFYLETQATYIRQALFIGTAWTQCNSWYRTKQGRIVANWPGYMREYSARTRTLNPDEFTFLPSPPPSTPTPAPDSPTIRSR